MKNGITKKKREEQARNLEVGIDLAEAAIEMTREHLKRKNPGLSPEEIEQLVMDWLHDRPNEGDCPGRRVELSQMHE